MKSFVVLGALLVGLAAASLTPPANNAASVRATRAPKIAFNYNQHGADWPGTCSTGKAQSPININTSATVCVRHGEETANPYRIHFHYHEHVQNMSLSNNGHTLKVKGDLGHVTIGGCNPCTGQEYRVKQFQFHTPGEHTINANPAANKTGAYAMELHIFHQKVGSTGLKDIVAVAVQFYVQPEGGFPNSFLEHLNWLSLPATRGASTPLTGGVNLHRLKEALHNAEYYTYQGSLDIPPCTEDVKWFVMKTPLGMTQKQLDSVQALFQKNTAFAGGNGNNRAVQPTNGRSVVWYRRQH